MGAFMPFDKEYVFFREDQQFRHPLLWALLLLIAGIAHYSFWMQIILGVPPGTNPAPNDLVFVIWLIFGLIFPLFFLALTLSVKVKNDGIYYLFYPFHVNYQRIAPDDIREVQVRAYRPLREYGGWGIRYGARGRAYTVRGNRGVEITLVSGNRILFGTMHADSMEAAIRLMMHMNKDHQSLGVAVE